jgi:site-specific DNA recombinase
MTRERDELQLDAKKKRGKLVYRDRDEWISVKVPAIVSQELFDAVQERLREQEDRYRQPIMHYLLSGLVQCGECGSGYSSARRYATVTRYSGKVSIYRRAGAV